MFPQNVVLVVFYALKFIVQDFQSVHGQLKTIETEIQQEAHDIKDKISSLCQRLLACLDTFRPVNVLSKLEHLAEDALYGCEERMPHLYHSHPNKPVQGMFFVKRPENERGTNAKEYYSPFLDQLEIELDY